MNRYGNGSPNVTTREEEDKGKDALNDQTVESTTARALSSKGDGKQISESAENPKFQETCSATGGEEGGGCSLSFVPKGGDDARRTRRAERAVGNEMAPPPRKHRSTEKR